MAGKRISEMNRNPFKQTISHKKEKVSNVKPYTIPDLEGQAAKVFERQIKKPPTAIQKRMIKEGTIVFAQTKRHK